MKVSLSHVAVWTADIERSRAFYVHYFNGTSNEQYTNEAKGFASYFVSFDLGASLEIMQRIDIDRTVDNVPHIGLAHIAFEVGGAAMVDQMTATLRGDGYSIVGEPRLTGDGFYEASVLDPDGNVVEMVG